MSRVVPGLFIQFTGAERSRRVGRVWHRKVRGGPNNYVDVRGFSEDVKAWAEHRSPVVTGDYRDAWEIENLNLTDWDKPLFVLANHHPSAKAIEYGASGPYWIFPNPARGPRAALKFVTSGGKNVFAASVWHPGTKPHGVGRAAVTYAARVFKKHKNK